MIQAKLQQCVGDSFIVVTQNIFGAKKIAGNAANPEALNLVDIGDNRLRAFSRIASAALLPEQGLR